MQLGFYCFVNPAREVVFLCMTCRLVVVYGVDEAAEGGAAFAGALVDTGILQNLREYLAGFCQDDVQSVVRGEGILLLQLVHPVGMLDRKSVV